MSAAGQVVVPDEVRWEQALHLARTVPLLQPPRWPGAGLRRAAVVGALALAGCALVAAALTHVLPDHADGWGDPGRSAGLGRAFVAVAVAVLGMVPVAMGAALTAVDAPRRWSRPWPPSVLMSVQRRTQRLQVQREVALDQRALPLALHVAQRAAPSDGLLVMLGGLALGQAGAIAEHTGWFALVPAASSAFMGVVVVLLLLRAPGGGVRPLHGEAGP